MYVPILLPSASVVFPMTILPAQFVGNTTCVVVPSGAGFGAPTALGESLFWKYETDNGAVQ